MSKETEYTLSYAVQAAAMRVPFLPMLGVIDQTDIASVRKDLKKFPCPLTGADLYAVPALSLDVAIIHTSAADQFGNCNFQGQLGIDTYLPMVADLTIVTTERIVSTDELIAMPGAVQIPGLTVTHVVKAPGGSLPTSCLPSVSLDMEALLDYADAARNAIPARVCLSTSVNINIIATETTMLKALSGATLTPKNLKLGTSAKGLCITCV